MKFFIYSPPYDENSGGSIALHRLCHLINTISPYKAYLVPFSSPIRQKFRMWKNFTNVHYKKNYLIHKKWITPLWPRNEIPQNAITIYPETIEGNPLNTKHVVRWLLHQPGFHTGNINYGDNELYFKFNSAIRDFSYKNSRLSTNELKVIYYPIDIYYASKIEKSIKTCYMVRKGKNKTFCHPTDAILLDGKSHHEIAEIFRKSKRFICYDDYTAYSIFAILCDCESIVVPDGNMTIEEWYPNKNDRFGIAYGFSEEQLQWAKSTKRQVLKHIHEEHKKSEQNVLQCLKEMEKFFYKL